MPPAPQTLVAFTSDNGAQADVGYTLGSNGMLRCNKGSTWEGGVREPLIVRWPVHVPAGVRRLQPVSLMDLFATALAAVAEASETNAKALLADGSKVAIDGKSLLPVLRSDDAPSPHDAGLFYWRGDRIMAVRVGPFKVHFFTQGCTNYTYPPLTSHEAGPLVFQLDEDAGEGYPLDPNVDAAAAAAVKRAVLARDAHLKEVGALAKAQLDMCDPAAFEWPPGQAPPSHPYECNYERQ